MVSSSENVAKIASASSGWICRRRNRFVVRDGNRVNAASIVIKTPCLQGRGDSIQGGVSSLSKNRNEAVGFQWRTCGYACLMTVQVCTMPPDRFASLSLKQGHEGWSCNQNAMNSMSGCADEQPHPRSQEKNSEQRERDCPGHVQSDPARHSMHREPFPFRSSCI